MAKQFSNAFVRQLGRETAHSVYNEVVNTQKSYKTIEGKDLKVGIPDKLNYTWFAILNLLIPFGGIITLIQGVFRLFSGKIRYYYSDIVCTYAQDRRYNSGTRSTGSFESRRYIKLDKADTDPEIVRAYEKHALLYIILSVISIVVAFLFWRWAVAL